MKEFVSDPFTGGAVGASRKASIHLHVINGTVGLSGVKCVKVHNRNGNNLTSQIIGANLA